MAAHYATLIVQAGATSPSPSGVPGATSRRTHARRERDHSSAQRAPWEKEQSGTIARGAVNLGSVGMVYAASPEGSAAHTEEEFNHP